MHASAVDALTTVVATSYLGVSIHRMDDLVKTPGGDRFQQGVGVGVGARPRRPSRRVPRPPLDQGPCSFIAADALTTKVREVGRVVKVAVLVATGVNADGHREILGLQLNSVEDGTGWLTFWRGLNGVKLVTSDARFDFDRY